MKILLIVFLYLLVFNRGFGQNSSDQKLDAEVIYPKIRNWTSPSNGEEAEFNSPSFQWPSVKKANYSIRISSSKDFTKDVIEKDGIPFAIFNAHKVLAEGTWYWQYKHEKKNWGIVDSFFISKSTPIFPIPEFAKVASKINSAHPRVLVQKESLKDFRLKSLPYKERTYVITEADKYLEESPPEENSGKPTFEGKNDFENEKLAQKASKGLGERLSTPLTFMSQAYVLTGDEKYFLSAKIWMLKTSAISPDGVTVLGNFGDASIMSSLAVGLDTFWDKLSPMERDTIIIQVAARANRFYNQWKSQIEARSSSMHVWQGILLDMFKTSTALMNERAEAALWMEYIYELWIAQSPKMGEKDGAWFNGVGYFKLNTLAMYEISFSLNELTGVDFMWNSWFKNNPRWLMYAYPPGSVTDGFCNGSDNNLPTISRHAAYSNIAARVFNDPYAAWYAAECEKKADFSIQDESEFYWFRLKRSNDLPLPASPKNFELPQAAVFPDVGVAYMHTSMENAEKDLMFSIRSSPFGPMGHAHADQNTFNIAYGGKKLFYNSGYRPTMGDPHFLGWFKHTQGHNGILIDGEGQPFNAGAYGWVPRFLHGKQISYAVGDASNAYSGKDEGQNIDFGMKKFRRHYIMLRPSIIVIYDDLEADHAAEWSWLLHNESGLEIDKEMKTIFAQNEDAKAKVSLFASSAIDLKVSDQFSIPVENWTNKTDEEGNIIDFKNQWHFKVNSKAKTTKMRYLAVIEVKPDGNFEQLVAKDNGYYAIGNWNVKAEMNASKPANIQVWNNDMSASLVSDGVLKIDRKTIKGKGEGFSKLMETIDGKEEFQETMDVIPEALRKVLLRQK